MGGSSGLGGTPSSGGGKKPSGGSTTGDTENTKQVEHQRTEFIIVFVWREPTPSAPLRKEEGGPLHRDQHAATSRASRPQAAHAAHLP